MIIYEDAIKELLVQVTGAKPELLPLSKPKELAFGDYACAVFQVAKTQNKNPVEFAKELEPIIQQKLVGHKFLTKATAVGPYINFFVNQADYVERVLTKIRSQADDYGSSIPMVHYHYVLDYSAPNIAKPFGIGHLRSTVIGGAIKKILQFSGHRVIGLNYIGDWGTQFGKVIYAYKTWGNEEELKKGAVKYLLSLYVRFHEEAEKDPKLEDAAREIFSQLESANEEYLALWKTFRELSLAEFEKIYQMMNVDFEEVRGESYYNEKMQAVVDEMKQKNLLVEDDGALIVKFDNHNIALPNCIIIKSNGASTYLLRDIASARDRIESFGADFLLYEVGGEQKLHFQQLIAILKLLGHDWSDRMVHIDHGLYRFNDAKMSTRKGNIVLMEDVLNESVERVKAIIREKNPELAAKPEFEEVARQVGVGAVMFFDLLQDRQKDVAFDWEKVLDFAGESGPYIQYTHARIQSIIQKYGKKLPMRIEYAKLTDDLERRLVTKLEAMPVIVDQCLKSYKPHTLARYVLDVAQLFNEYYAKQRVIVEDEATTAARIVLINSVKRVIANSLRLLGIDAPREM
ncbi:MAG TPA: arginine--tRNA ligase [Acidobacteriota bacterium]|nr:arginine--tRNA ligase [Acidobacteriota bacterium]